MLLNQLGAEVTDYSLDPPTVPNLFSCLNLGGRISHNIGDIRDEKNIFETIESTNPDIIIHRAAQPIVKKSYSDNKLTYETNVMGTINILESVKLSGNVKVVIVVTSDKCYENKDSISGYKEIDRLGGFDPYSSSKACVELIVNAYRNSFFNENSYGNKHNVSISTVRAGNIIGGGDWGDNRLIPDCVKALSQKKI